MKRRNVRTLSLIVVTFTYLLIGAAVFDALEGENNQRAHDALIQLKQDFMSKYNVSSDDYKVMELLVLEKKAHRSGPQWKFAGSFYYALVVLALIGYGHSTPATTMGKAFTMCYAMAGIPMAMIMFQCMGERMNKLHSILIRRFRSVRGHLNAEASESDLIMASAVTSSLVVFCGAVMYHTQEGWAFFDAYYYTLITLSTIGFGDFVALQEGNALQFRPAYVVCSFVFLLLGLAALSSLTNLLVLRFMIISLEEEEQLDQESLHQCDDLDHQHAIAQLYEATSERDLRLIQSSSRLNAEHRKLKDQASVCSCTCYNTARRPLWRRLLSCGQMSDASNDHYYDEASQSIKNVNKRRLERAASAAL